MNKSKSNSFLAISFSQGFLSPNIPIATLTQGDKELNFIIDTGSDRNVIDCSALEELEYQKDENNKMHLTGLGGTQEVEICKLTFTCDGKEYTSEFLVSDLKEAFDSIKKAHAIPIHGMLGSVFLRENNLILDFNNLVLYNKE